MTADPAGDYAGALTWLLTLNDLERRPVTPEMRGEMGLARPAALLERLGNPQNSYLSVLIAGSKGKGSTAAFLASILQYAGIRTGFYSKPHLHTYRERIRVDGHLIDKEQFARGIGRIRPHVQAVAEQTPLLGEPTTFEVTTALALQHFAEAGVQVAVIEVGLGGRLDATNVISADLSVITSISLEHTAVLGDTLAQIATEKAGIVKPGRPALSAPQQAEAARVLRQSAELNHSAFGIAPEDWSWRGVSKRFGVAAGNARPGLWSAAWQHRDLSVALLGMHQVENAATAVAAAEALAHTRNLSINHSDMVKGLELARWPGRLEVAADGDKQHAPVVVDGAHNGDSAARLEASLRAEFGPRQIWLVIGVYGDKDLDAIVQPFKTSVAQAWAVGTRQPRALPAEVMASRLNALGIPASPAASTAQALGQARRSAAREDLVLVTGSFSAVAEAREALGLVPESERDPLIQGPDGK